MFAIKKVGYVSKRWWSGNFWMDDQRLAKQYATRTDAENELARAKKSTFESTNVHVEIVPVERS